MESNESFEARVLETVGVPLAQIKVRDVRPGEESKLGGTIFCARFTKSAQELLMSDTYPDEQDEETGAEIWKPIPSNFVLCRLV
jgi:hypothetical protein